MNPANAKFCCSGGCGLVGQGVGVPAGVAVHWSATQNSPSVVTSGPSPMLGPRCYHFDFYEEWLGHTFAAALGSGATVVARFYVYFSTLPTITTSLFWLSDSSGSAGGGVNFDASDGTIRAGWRGGALETGASGVAVTTNTWYCVDVKVVCTATLTVDVSVNETPTAQFTRSVGAINPDRFRIGFSASASQTINAYMTNIVVSSSSADYPIGPGQGVALYPNADRTNTVASGVGNGGHRYSAVTDFGKGSGGGTNLAAQNVESTAWQSLQNPLDLNVQTNFVANKTGASGGAEYVVFELENLPADAVSVNAGMVVITTHSASNTTNDFSFQINYSGTAGITGDFSNTSIANPIFTIPFSTVTHANNSYGLFFSEDVNPDVYLDGFCMEVDYVPEDTGLEGAISPATFTLTPVALSTTIGTVSQSITPVAFSFVPVALSASVGTATASISPVIFTLTPVEITPDLAQYASISPADFTLSPQPLSASVGTATASISPASFTLTPVALTGVATGEAFGSISPVSLTLSAVGIVGSGSGSASTSISPSTFTLTPVALTTSVGAASGSISPVTVSLVPVALEYTLGAVATSLSPVTFTFTPIGLGYSLGTASGSIDPVVLTLVAVEITGGEAAPGAGSISPAIFTLQPVALTASIGTVQASISPAIITLTPVALGHSVGDASGSISPVLISLTPTALGYSIGVASGSISPATITLTPVALGHSVGTASGSISPVLISLTPIGLSYSIGTASGSISPVLVSLTPVSLGYSVGDVSTSVNPVVLTLVAVELDAFEVVAGEGSISPAIFTLTPVALVSSAGQVSLSINPVVMSLTPEPITASVGGVTAIITPVTMTLTPTGLSYSVGGVTTTINSVVITLIASQIIASITGGRIYVWNGIEWDDKPVKRWTGTEWVEKPMKVWNGSIWEFA